MKKLLVDMMKLRAMGDTQVQAIDRTLLTKGEYKTIKELATFKFTCRRCEDAPCISSCPTDALKKNEDQTVTRSVNLCIQCKSCVVSCPFGTMSLDIFKPAAGARYYDLSRDDDLLAYANNFPEDVVRITKEEPDPENHTYPLNDRILIKDFKWNN